MDKKILFATKNPDKLREVKEIAGDRFKILGLKDIGLESLSVEENGSSFEKNAKIKALFYSKYTDLPVLADDSGLVIDFLNGEPGVYSARYLGETLSYDDKCKIILKKMKEAKKKDLRSARFVCVCCLALKGRVLVCKEGRVEGYIAYSPSGKNGFGYDPIFFYPELNMTFADMPEDTKNRISHRFKAFSQMFGEIKNIKITP